MGTDIHLYVEKYNESGGYWEAVAGPNPRIKDNLEYAKWARERGDMERARELEKEAADIASGEAMKTIKHRWEFDWIAPKVFEGWLYSGRNYNLFAILGNVRNGHGFAGVETGAGFNYISNCRGIPDNASDDVQEYMRGDDYYHSVSYVTLRELVQFDWNQVTTLYGTISEKAYKEYRETGVIPDSYSGSVWGQKIKTVDQNELNDILDGKKQREEGIEYYTRISWHETYKNTVGSFYPDSIEELKKLSESIDCEDVRIVFGFDS